MDARRDLVVLLDPQVAAHRHGALGLVVAQRHVVLDEDQEPAVGAVPADLHPDRVDGDGQRRGPTGPWRSASTTHPRRETSSAVATGAATFPRRCDIDGSLGARGVSGIPARASSAASSVTLTLSIDRTASPLSGERRTTAARVPRAHDRPEREERRDHRRPLRRGRRADHAPRPAARGGRGGEVSTRPTATPIQAVEGDTEPTQKIEVDGSFADIDVETIDALVVPGGTVNADQLRVERRRRPLAAGPAGLGAGKPLAVICHGPWLLVSAGAGRGPPADQLPLARHRHQERRGRLGGRGGGGGPPPHHQPQPRRSRGVRRRPEDALTMTIRLRPARCRTRRDRRRIVRRSRVRPRRARPPGRRWPAPRA